MRYTEEQRYTDTPVFLWQQLCRTYCSLLWTLEDKLVPKTAGLFLNINAAIHLTKAHLACPSTGYSTGPKSHVHPCRFHAAHIPVYTPGIEPFLITQRIEYYSENRVSNITTAAVQSTADSCGCTCWLGKYIVFGLRNLIGGFNENTMSKLDTPHSNSFTMNGIRKLVVP